MLRFGTLLMVFLLLTACDVSTTGSSESGCSLSDGRRAFDALNSVAQEWDDAVKLAGQTTRITIAPQIASLQGIRRTVQQQNWPSCAQPVQQSFIAYMDEMINGYLAFMGNAPEAEYQGHFDKAHQLLSTFREEMSKLSAQ